MSSRLKFELAPDWETIKATWEPCLDHLNRHGLGADTAYSLAMVVQELLENAVKYGTFAPGRDQVRLQLTANEDTVTIEVRAPLNGDLVRLKRLDGMIQWIRGFQNPFEAYLERLKEVSSQPFASPESGLGLVRVAYEGQCLLDFFVDDTNVLAMSAVYRPPAGLPQENHANPTNLHQ